MLFFVFLFYLGFVFVITQEHQYELSGLAISKFGSLALGEFGCVVNMMVHQNIRGELLSSLDLLLNGFFFLSSYGILEPRCSSLQSLDKSMMFSYLPIGLRALDALISLNSSVSYSFLPHLGYYL